MSLVMGSCDRSTPMIFSLARGLTAAVAWLRMFSRAASSQAIISGSVEPPELIPVVRQHHSQPVQSELSGFGMGRQSEFLVSSSA